MYIHVYTHVYVYINLKKDCDWTYWDEGLQEDIRRLENSVCAGTVRLSDSNAILHAAQSEVRMLHQILTLIARAEVHTLHHVYQCACVHASLAHK